MTTQLSFDLPARAALGRDDFFISPSNHIAVSMIDNWPKWSNKKLLLTGPEGSGKTHLAHVWAAQSGATIVAAKDLREDAVLALSRGPIAVENIQMIHQISIIARPPILPHLLEESNVFERVLT